MDVRQSTLSIGWSIFGAGMGLAGGSNMLDELPEGLAPVAFGLLGIGATMIVVGRYVLPHAPNPDEPTDSN